MAVVVIVVPAPMGVNNATAQGQEGKQGNQPCDSTQHFGDPHGYRRNEAKTLHRL
jgi:hypothetical protein